MAPPHTLTARQAMEAEDAPLNILTKEPNDGAHRKMLEGRRKLPVGLEATRQEFLTLYQNPNNQFVVFVGGTGSGKSTQIPQIVLQDHSPDEMKKSGRKIVATQTRQVATSMVCERVAAEAGVVCGREIGYRFKGKREDSNRTMLLFETDGLLLAEAMGNRLLPDYDAILIDEAHERTIAIDILIGILKQTVKDRPELKVVIMSATLAIEQFQQYLPTAVTQTVVGTNFPVEIFYAATRPQDVLIAAAQTAIRIHLKEPEGAILIFVSGAPAIETVHEALRKLVKSDGYPADAGPLDIHELSASTQSEATDEALKGPAPLSPTSRPGRKIIIATNIAETSVTIEGLVYVVDTGLKKEKVYDSRTCSWLFFEIMISHAQIAQRKGRVGRTRPGKCFRLYTELDYWTQFPRTTMPQILTVSLTATMLKLITLAYDPYKFDFMTPPAIESVNRAMGELYFLGCIDRMGGMTKTGHLSFKLGLDPYQAVCMDAADRLGCASEIASIIAMVQATKGKSVWRPVLASDNPGGEKKRKDAMKRYRHPRGGHIALLMIYLSYRQAVNNKSVDFFCKRDFMLKSVLESADHGREVIVLKMKKGEIVPRHLDLDDRRDHLSVIIQALCAGYFMQSAKRVHVKSEAVEGVKVPLGEISSFETVQTNLEVGIREPLEFDIDNEAAKWVIFEECVKDKIGQLPSLRCVTPVNPDWLLVAGAKNAFFDLERFSSGHIKDSLTAAYVGADPSLTAELLHGSNPLS